MCRSMVKLRANLRCRLHRTYKVSNGGYRGGRFVPGFAARLPRQILFHSKNNNSRNPGLLNPFPANLQNAPSPEHHLCQSAPLPVSPAESPLAPQRALNTLIRALWPSTSLRLAIILYCPLFSARAVVATPVHLGQNAFFREGVQRRESGNKQCVATTHSAAIEA